MSQTHDLVREHYAKVAETDGACGCAPGCCTPSADASRKLGYTEEELASLPAGADMGLGCGTPLAFAGLRTGETALDLGSGGGLDCFLAARQVGPNGRVIGVDMTPEMLGKARINAEHLEAANVEFRLGEIEHLPVADRSVDVIVSNCVINLSSDKDAVLREAFRVLKPGGRFAVSDVVVRGALPEALRRSMELWVGCVAGALSEREYTTKLRAAGFADVEIEPWRIYEFEDAKAFLRASGLDVDSLAPQVAGRVASAFIRARKPETAACCNPTCCGRP